jgi:hypothetical protein
MNRIPHLAALAASLLASAVFAQAPPPLNLKLPPNSAPAASATAPTPRADPPGTFYGDTSGRMGNTVADAAACDDSTYNKPQVHGSVGMGVMSGSHVGGTWNGGNVNISQAFGSCDDPGGGVSISVGGSRGNFHGRGR